MKKLVRDMLMMVEIGIGVFFCRSIQNNRFCFMEQAFENGYLHAADYAVLDQWYRWTRANVDISLDLIGKLT